MSILASFKSVSISRASPRQLAALSLVVWVVALACPVFVIYGRQDAVGGLNVLVIGWLYLAAGCIAWLANPLFLVAIYRCAFGEKSGLGFAIAAGLVSLTSFALEEITQTGTIYGYGIGIVLWLLAMGLALMATGAREHELSGRIWVYRLGVCWLVAIVAGFTAVGIQDRRGANAAETQRFKSAVVKRGSVCRLESSTPAALQSFDGTLEVIMGPGSSIHPFYGPGPLLSWGVRVVRMNGFDYSLLPADEDIVIRSVATRTAPSVVIIGDAARVRITSGDGQVVAADQSYAHDGPEYCPDLTPNSFKPDDQPRKLIVAALGLAGSAAKAPSRYMRAQPQPLNAKVVGRESASPGDWRGNNAGCEGNIGYRSIEVKPVSGFGRAFHAADVEYYFPENPSTSVCTRDSVYLYSSGRNGTDFFLTIHKRSLSDFRRRWSAQFKIGAADPALERDQSLIQAIDDDGKTLTIRMRSRDRDEVFVLEAPVPQQLSPTEDSEPGNPAVH